VIYLFVDGLAERLHLGQPREAVLAACGDLRRSPAVGAGVLQDDFEACIAHLRFPPADRFDRSHVEPTAPVTASPTRLSSKTRT